MSGDMHRQRKAALQQPGFVADKGFTINRIGEMPVHGVVPASAKYGHEVTAKEEESNK